MSKGVSNAQPDTVVSSSYVFHTSPVNSAKILQETRVLLDILVHDIRNYNQAALFTAESLSHFEPNNSEYQSLIKRLISAIDRSSLLLKRASQYEKCVLSDNNPELFPVNLKRVVMKSLYFIKQIIPDRNIVETLNFPLHVIETNVMADDLLDEVFANLFSNCVRYTESSTVPLGISIEDGEERERNFWKVSVSDHGSGISEAMKSNVFNRHQRGAKGSGLGLSIVHGLVVDRYHGKIELKNRVEGDYKQGTIVEILLPKSG